MCIARLRTVNGLAVPVLDREECLCHTYRMNLLEKPLPENCGILAHFTVDEGEAWSYHIGCSGAWAMNHKHDKRLVGIEVASIGPLELTA